MSSDKPLGGKKEALANQRYSRTTWTGHIKVEDSASFKSKNHFHLILEYSIWVQGF